MWLRQSLPLRAGAKPLRGCCSQSSKQNSAELWTVLNSDHNTENEQIQRNQRSPTSTASRAPACAVAASLCASVGACARSCRPRFSLQVVLSLIRLSSVSLSLSRSLSLSGVCVCICDNDDARTYTSTHTARIDHAPRRGTKPAGCRGRSSDDDGGARSRELLGIQPAAELSAKCPSPSSAADPKRPSAGQALPDEE